MLRGFGRILLSLLVAFAPAVPICRCDPGHCGSRPSATAGTAAATKSTTSRAHSCCESKRSHDSAPKPIPATQKPPGHGCCCGASDRVESLPVALPDAHVTVLAPLAAHFEPGFVLPDAPSIDLRTTAPLVRPTLARLAYCTLRF